MGVQVRQGRFRRYAPKKLGEPFGEIDKSNALLTAGVCGFRIFAAAGKSDEPDRVRTFPPEKHHDLRQRRRSCVEIRSGQNGRSVLIHRGSFVRRTGNVFLVSRNAKPS